jgi:hypothetical protein
MQQKIFCPKIQVAVSKERSGARHFDASAQTDHLQSKSNGIT